MQKSETGAAVPRHMARQHGKAFCDLFNTTRRNQHPQVNSKTGLMKDQTGKFETVMVPKKRVLLPA